MASLCTSCSAWTVAAVFSGVSVLLPCAAPGSAQAGEPDRALIEFSVEPVARGSALQKNPGRVRLGLDYMPEEGVRLAPVDLQRNDSVDEAVQMAGLAGPSLVWEAGSEHAPGFVAAVMLHDARPAREFDDRAARGVHWPIAGWPEEVGGMLHPDARADELDADLRRLVESWLGARNRAVTPAVLSKYLAARVMTHAHANLEPLLVRDGSERGVVGIRSRGVSGFARTGNGSEFDMLRAYAATLRIAGIPARLAVGARTGDAPAVHGWVEFYQYDERARTGGWVAVDLVSQRRLSTQPPAIADEWRHFGVRSGLIPVWFGVPRPLAEHDGVLAPWRLECDPPCVPVRITARVARAPLRPGMANAGSGGSGR